MTLLDLGLATVASDVGGLKAGASAKKLVQLSLPRADVEPVEKCPKKKPPSDTEKRASGDLEEYRRRLIDFGVADKTVRSYLYQIDRIVEAAGESADIMHLFLSPKILGRALVSDRSKQGSRLSKWTLDQGRAGIRSFSKLMAPELRRLTGREPDEIVNEALRLVAVRRGSRYYLPGGRPRQRGGPAPTSEAISDTIEETARAQGFKGCRDRAFFTVLYGSGARVNALRKARCSDLVILPGGSIRMMLHEKGRSLPREVLLSSPAAELLVDYIDALSLPCLASSRQGRRIEIYRRGRRQTRSCGRFAGGARTLR